MNVTKIMNMAIILIGIFRLQRKDSYFHHSIIPLHSSNIYQAYHTHTLIGQTTQFSNFIPPSLNSSFETRQHKKNQKRTTHTVPLSGISCGPFYGRKNVKTCYSLATKQYIKPKVCNTVQYFALI